MFAGVLLLGLATLSESPAAFPQPPVREAIEAWIRQEVARASSPPAAFYEWRLESHYVPSVADVENLRRAIAGRPDHPDRATVEAYDRRQAGQPDVERRQLWFGQSGHWRYSSDLPEATGGYLDCALTPSAGWQLSPGHLTIYNPKEGFPQGQDLRGKQGAILAELLLLVTGGLNIIPAAGLTWEIDEVSDSGEFTVRAHRVGIDAPAQAYEVRFEGKWNSHNGFAQIDVRTLMMYGPNPDSQGQQRHFLDWAYEPTIGRWVARRVEIWTPEGQLHRRLRLEAVRPLQTGELDRATAQPAASGQDLVRGAVILANVADYSRGEFHRSDGHVFPIQRPIDARAWRHRAAIVVPVAVVLIVLGLYIRKRLA